METNTDTIVETIKSDSFKHTLVKLAVGTAVSVIARKFAEELVDRIHDRRHAVATVETTEA